MNVYNRAKKLIEPYDISTFNVIEVDGKNVVVINIDGNATRVTGLTVNGISYQRRGASVIPITAQAIVEKLIPNLPKESEERAHISDLALKIEELNRRLIDAGSWKSKLMDMLLGGIIGAVISILFSVLIGFGA